MKIISRTKERVIRIGRKAQANQPVLKLLEEVREYVLANPDAESLVVMVGSPGSCRPFMTPVSNPLDFIGMLELMKHNLIRGE